MIEVTEVQIEEMKHALGLNYHKERTRNYFYTDADDREWNDLVAKGFAMKRKGWDGDSAYFILTEEGIQFIESKGAV